MKRKNAFLALAALASTMYVTAQNPNGPTMGWSSWNTYGVNINEDLIKCQADAMVETGLSAVGYNHINIDDGFFGGRNEQTGELLIHPQRFPNGLKPVADYIHSKGLKAGIYSDAGANTCGNYYNGDSLSVNVGLYNYDQRDCDYYFRECGFDFIKVDFCGGDAPQNSQRLALDPEERYTSISKAIRKTGRKDVRLNVCRWDYPGTWVHDVAFSWRTTRDISNRWSSVRGILAENLYMSAYQSAGHYNDMDMLEVGRAMTDEEDRTHFGMWCIMSSPLLIGCDLTKIKPATLELLTNEELIALNQDPLCLQAYVVAMSDGCHILVKDIETLGGKKRAFAVYNPNDQERHPVISFRDLDLGGTVRLRDVFLRKDAGAYTSALSLAVPAHGTRIYVAEGDSRLERTRYEAETAYISNYQELKNNQTEHTGIYERTDYCSAGYKASWLGGSEKSDLQWRNVYSQQGGRYVMKIAYIAGDRRQMTVSVNGKTAGELTVEKSGPQTVAFTTIEIKLDKGRNTVRLANATSRMPDIDYMELTPVVTHAFSGYLFAYFEGRGEHQEHLRFAISDDAVNWHALNNNQPIVMSDTISESGGIRDPHILRGEQGDYYIVATDMHTRDPKQGWKENPGMVLMRSSDLVHWTHASINLSKTYPKHFADAYWVWAPQTIYDRKARKYMIYFTLKRRDSDDLVTYYAYANRDFTAFEDEPKVLFRAKYGCIDNDIIEGPDGTFHMFYKGNTKNTDGKEVNNGIEQATAKSLKGPWKEHFSYIDPYAGTNTNVEGSSVFKLNGEDKWVLMYDLYSSGRYEYQTTTDLETFTPKSRSFTKDFFPRHGSVISVTEDEMQRLQEQWGYVGTYHFEATGNPLIRHTFTADPATLVKGDTLWLFTGCDEKEQRSGFQMNHWQVFSTTDLRHWTQHPTPLTIDEFKWAERGQAYAAQVIERGGKYYFYVSTDRPGIGVAVSDRPEGPYHDALGKPLLTNADCFASRHSWACIDPTVFIDTDGQAWLAWGNGQCYIAKLKENMIEIDGEIQQIQFSEDYPFEEAPWLHKYNGRYYLTYATGFPEKIAYAAAKNITGPYTPMGIISETAGNSDTTHPAIVEFKGQWLFFSHNGALPKTGNTRHRSVICEPIHYNRDGSIQPIPASSNGISQVEMK